MERFLIENQILQTADKKNISRTSACPDDHWYWDFMDDRVADGKVTTHAVSCAYCRNQLSQVARAMLAVPEGATGGFAPSLSIAADAADEKVILQTIGGYILELFNSMEAVPAYRAHASGPMVLAALGNLANFKIELSTSAKGKYSLVAHLGADKGTSDVTLELSDATGVLRSFSLRLGDRRSLGEWVSGRYRVTLKQKDKDNYVMELDLR